MSALVSVDPEAEGDITFISERFADEGLKELLDFMARFIDALRLRMRDSPVSDWDADSIYAMDEFLRCRCDTLVVDNDKLYFVAKRGVAGQSAIIITKAGAFTFG